jgi:hypothetical protein
MARKTAIGFLPRNPYYSIKSELFASKAKSLDAKIKAHKISFESFHFCQPIIWLRLVRVGFLSNNPRAAIGWQKKQTPKLCKGGTS